MHPHDNAEALLRVLTAPRRGNFFYGKRMDVPDFQTEQAYGKLKQWLVNRLTVGKGVLCGLRVSVDGNRVCVDPGVAIDGLGREIVMPVRTCIDPLRVDEGCCGRVAATPEQPPTGPAGAEPGGSATGSTRRLYTLWLCYRECLADRQPTFVSDCDSRDHCASGTIVETFCLKVAPGLAPPSGDPAWCPRLWEPHGEEPGGGEEPPRPGATIHTHLTTSTTGPDPQSTLTAAQTSAVEDALRSRRHLLCELFDGTCDPGEADACVPIAAIAAIGDRLVVENCLVRPRLYSNERLLDLILCLAARIDECCRDHPPTAAPITVRSIAFVHRDDNGTELAVASVQSPLVDTAVDIAGDTNALRIRFSTPFALDVHKPTTHGSGDVDFKRHNVQVLPSTVLGNVPFVPGSLAIEAADTVRFDLSRDSPYARDGGGWQKGRYRIFLRGDEDLANNRPALADLGGAALDGEPIEPAAGAISGDGTKGGDFVADFVVGAGETPRATMRVASVEFLERSAAAGSFHPVAAIVDPQTNTAAGSGPAAIRIRFTEPFAQQGASRPTTHGVDDADFARHNVQVRLSARDARRRGVAYVPGSLVVESADTLRFDVATGTRVVGPTGAWPNGLTSCSLFLRGSVDADRPALTDSQAAPLDGEPTAPAAGVISGDATPGGNFAAAFSVQTVA